MANPAPQKYFLKACQGNAIMSKASEKDNSEVNPHPEIALSKEELRALGLNIGSASEPDEPEPQNYEVLSKEELRALGLNIGSAYEPDESEPQNHEALSKEELRAPELNIGYEPEPQNYEAIESDEAIKPDGPEPQNHEPESQNHEATVAISKEELRALGLKFGSDEPEPELPEPESEHQDHEATVAISKEELRALGLEAGPDDDSQDHDEPALSPEAVTPDIGTSPKEESVPSPPEPSPPAASAEEADETSEEVSAAPDSEEVNTAPDFEDTLPGEDPASVDFGSKEYASSELENTYYRRSVKKQHGGGKYKFQRNIVSGGMGSILKVLDQDLQRSLAMKVILPKFKKKDGILTDFISEAKITGLLEHPNIIPVHELGLTRDTGLFFTMKLLSTGEALNDVLNEIKQGKPEYVEKYTTYRLLNIFRKVCDSVSFAHSKSILHQDIKPHNIMVGEYGEVLLMDWGIATFFGDPEQENDPVMREFREDIMNFSKGKDDIIKGSPTYMAPEQVSGDPRLLDNRSDIFLLGSTLYHIFTFEPPYFGKNIYEIIQKAESGDLLSPQDRNPARQIPEEICRIIMKAMAHKKKDRYQSVEDMAQDIDDIISGKWSQQEKKMFAAGEMLMRQGETGEEAYLILTGKVQVFIESDGRKVVLATLKEGDVIGEMSLISKEKLTRSASVEAIEETEAAVLTKHVIDQNLKKLPPYMEKIVSTLTDRLRTANENVHPHVSDDSAYYILKQLRLTFRDRSNNKVESFKMPAKELVKEIAEDLGISTQKVKKVLNKALKAKLITGKKGMVQIPDIVELTRFTEFEKPSTE